jgi:hypothetical protein
MYRHRNVYLGPPGKKFFFEARYIAYVVFVPMCGLTFGGTWLVGISPGPAQVAWAVLLTWLGLKMVDHERPLRTVLWSLVTVRGLWSRPVTRDVTRVRPRVTSVRVTPPPEGRP